MSMHVEVNLNQIRCMNQLFRDVDIPVQQLLLCYGKMFILYIQYTLNSGVIFKLLVKLVITDIHYALLCSF